MGLKVFTNTKIHKPKVCEQPEHMVAHSSRRLFASPGKKLIKVNILNQIKELFER